MLFSYESSRDTQTEVVVGNRDPKDLMDSTQRTNTFKVTL